MPVRKDMSLHLKIPTFTLVGRGGKHENENVVLSCPSCNLRKGSKTEEEFASYLSTLPEEEIRGRTPRKH